MHSKTPKLLEDIRDAAYIGELARGRTLEDYDRDRVGWKVTELAAPPGPDVPPFERRKVYDTTRSGRSNAGHTFGDDLTDAERRAVIEYLKTL